MKVQRILKICRHQKAQKMKMGGSVCFAVFFVDSAPLGELHVESYSRKDATTPRHQDTQSETKTRYLRIFNNCYGALALHEIRTVRKPETGVLPYIPGSPACTLVAKSPRKSPKSGRGVRRADARHGRCQKPSADMQFP